MCLTNWSMVWNDAWHWRHVNICLASFKRFNSAFSSFFTKRHHNSWKLRPLPGPPLTASCMVGAETPSVGDWVLPTLDTRFVNFDKESFCDVDWHRTLLNVDDDDVVDVDGANGWDNGNPDKTSKNGLAKFLPGYNADKLSAKSKRVGLKTCWFLKLWSLFFCLWSTLDDVIFLRFTLKSKTSSSTSFCFLSSSSTVFFSSRYLHVVYEIDVDGSFSKMHHKNANI